RVARVARFGRRCEGAQVALRRPASDHQRIGSSLDGGLRDGAIFDTNAHHHRRWTRLRHACLGASKKADARAGGLSHLLELINQFSHFCAFLPARGDRARYARPRSAAGCGTSVAYREQMQIATGALRMRRRATDIISAAPLQPLWASGHRLQKERQKVPQLAWMVNSSSSAMAGQGAFGSQLRTPMNVRVTVPGAFTAKTQRQ